MKITEAIAAEHARLLRLFAEVERALTQVKSPAEVGALAAIVGGLLGDHSAWETHLALLPLDNGVGPTDALTRRAKEQQQIHERLRQVRRAATCAEARGLLLAALRASEQCFRQEERALFPAIERALGAQNQAPVMATLAKGRHRARQDWAREAA